MFGETKVIESMDERGHRGISSIALSIITVPKSQKVGWYSHKGTVKDVRHPFQNQSENLMQEGDLSNHVY